MMDSETAQAHFNRTRTLISEQQSRKVDNAVIARRLFAFDLPVVFSGKQDIAFDICNKVAEYFKVDINKVKIVGSAQLGYSIIKRTPFKSRNSDLDMAVIDQSTFCRLSERFYEITDGYTNFTEFTSRNSNAHITLIKYLSKGVIRTDFMPNCLEKRNWVSFFNKLSLEYSELFKNINCALYMSQGFFEKKQEEVIIKHTEHDTL